MSIHKTIKHQNTFAKKHIDVKLINRLRIFIIMYVALLAYMIYDISTHAFNPWLIIAAFIGGVIIGYLAGRMFDIRWHEETSKVVARLDKIGVIILILYIAFSVAREQIFSLWFQGAFLTAFSLTFGTGAILGRLLMMSKNIKKVLTEKGLKMYAEPREMQ